MPRPKRSTGAIIIETKPPLEVLARRFKAGQAERIGRGIGAAAGRLSYHLKRVTPKRSGALIQSQALKRMGTMEYRISEGMFYGAILRAGVPAARINPIFPRKKKALYWPGAAHPVKAVYGHPGIRKNDYFATAIKNAEGDMERAGEEIGKDIGASIVGH